MDENHYDNRINPKATTLSKVLEALLSGNIGQVPPNISQGERQLCLKIIGVMQSNKLINGKEKTRANKQIQNIFSLSALNREEKIVEIINFQSVFQKSNADNEENVRIPSTAEIWNEFEVISKKMEEDCLQIWCNYQIKNHLSQQMVNQQENQEHLLKQTITIKQLTIQIEENAIKLANEEQKNNKLMVANANHSNQIARYLKQIKQLQQRIEMMKLEKENIGKNKSMYDQSLILKIKEVVKQFSKQQKMNISQSSCEDNFIQEQQQDLKDKANKAFDKFIN